MKFSAFIDALRGSRTLSLAISLVPLLGSAFKEGKGDAWVFEKIPFSLRQNATLEKFDKVLASGKLFIQDCWEFFHK